MPAHDLAYGGWPGCIRLYNQACDLIVTADVGPRILRAGLIGEPNLLFEAPEDRGVMGGERWRMFGGHRLWHAPEDPARSYLPDNAPVEVDLDGDQVTLTPPTEARSGIQKRLTIALDGDEVTVTHRLENRGVWSVRLACWALTAMGPGSRAAIWRAPRQRHPEALLPTQSLVLWPYTDLVDPRLSWGSRLLRVRQEPERAAPLKIGADARPGEVIGWRAGAALRKRFEVVEGAAYPDRGCTVEVFTDHRMLEIETLGPLRELAPGEFTEHVERWTLRRMPAWPDEEQALAAALHDALG